MDIDVISKRIDNRLADCAKHLQRALEAEGFEAFFVGGFVRDAILERDAYDIDITTDALWQDVRHIALDSGFKTYETGIKHGTITVIDPLSDISIEVTTYRVDGNYADSRHPDKVEFISSLNEDLKRRDFTMNAIAYAPEKGLIDPLCGMQDIQNGIIRVVGDGSKRFTEDGLRILRAARFASQLGFTFEAATYEAMVRNKHMLANVSTERITHELDCLLTGDHALDALMQTADVIDFVLPELVAMKDCAQVTKYHIYDVFEHTAHVVQNVLPTRLNRWAALCHDIGKPAAAFFDEAGIEHFYGHAHVSENLTRGMLKRLLMAPAFIDDVCTLVRFHDIEIVPLKRSVKKMLQKLNGRQDLMRALLDIKRADAKGQAPRCLARLDTIDELERILDEVIKAEEAFSIKDLKVGGRDVIALGIEEGPTVGRILADVLDQVIDEKLVNERDRIIDYVQKVHL